MDDSILLSTVVYADLKMLTLRPEKPSIGKNIEKHVWKFPTVLNIK